MKRESRFFKFFGSLLVGFTFYDKGLGIYKLCKPVISYPWNLMHSFITMKMSASRAKVDFIENS